ncbi:TetR family transcriptional regulator [[Phormidium ambiguum] IAM M-71]|uniref:TetR family transcriptional regulator n=1 Tax=[Phormidium ambiguum] IAM M-71 TaxID=454136 RepID=A0A1U7I515_9CYAN|nr:TetR/AcrR family transcriptional regulator [Phormidium ambiguum]OKH31360.1 TetR family transcriptional regulator [Phormidium ambiguum IAM M-71]
MPKETYIPCLLGLFRQYGYDGATLSKISEATGLGKASLYHHFPGGKDQMVETVLDYLEKWLFKNILPALESEGDAVTRLGRMCLRLNELYHGGEQPCMFAILLSGSARDVFHAKVKALFQNWIDAIANVLIQSGIDAQLAKQRGEDAAIAIQGSLILSQAMDDTSVFRRTIEELPIALCR